MSDFRIFCAAFFVSCLTMALLTHPEQFPDPAATMLAVAAVAGCGAVVLRMVFDAIEGLFK